MRCIDLHFTDHHRVPPNPFLFTMHLSRIPYSTCGPPIFASSALCRSTLCCPTGHVRAESWERHRQLVPDLTIIHLQMLSEECFLLSPCLTDLFVLSHKKKNKQIRITHGRVTTEKNKSTSPIQAVRWSGNERAPSVQLEDGFGCRHFRDPLHTRTCSGMECGRSS